MNRRGTRRPLAALALGAALVPMTAVGSTAATATELYFSEYVEGSSNNKALELYNGTGAPVDLAAAGYNVQMFFNGSATAGLTVDLVGTVAPGDVFVLAQSAAGAAILAQADQTNGSGWFNGDDAVVLRKGTAVVDSIGQTGFDPGAEWGSGLTGTADNTLRRKPDVAGGDTNPGDAFDPAAGWEGFASDTFDGLGAHGGGSPDPDPEPEEPSAGCGDELTAVPEIQGSGAAAAVTGPVATEGVVVGDFEGASPNLRGFYLQDPDGDQDAATSDGVFVFNGNQDEVEVGQHVRVVGNAAEYQGQTQIGADGDGVVVCDAQPAALPEPAELVLPLADAERERFEGMLVVLPQPLAVTELYLLGRFGQVTMSAAPPYAPDSLGGRLPQPTNLVEPGPVSQAVQAENDRHRILFDDATNGQNPDPILFSRDETGLTADNTLRGGDTATGTVGVLTYTWAGNSASGNAYRVRPVGALGGRLDFRPANPRPARPADVGGGITAASFNVLNYFTTLDTSRSAWECRGGVAGPVTDCRGANSAVELERQAAKIVAALAGLDADVVGLVEIENDGYGEDSAIADLVRRLNAVAGADTYRYLDVDERSGQVDALGDDAIKVGMLYKPAEVVPNGETAVLNTASFVNGGTSSPKNRPALAQAFMDRDTEERFTMVVNHFKSKGSACGAGNDDPQTGQGSCNGTRVHAARELAAWLETFPTGIKEPDVLIMGDLNSYALEDPIDVIRDAGYTDLVRRDEGPGAYSYVFDGQWGYLDHALASASLAAQVTGTTTWHINSDEPPVLDYNTDFKSPGQVEGLYAPTPYRSSDHDPVLVGLRLTS